MARYIDESYDIEEGETESGRAEVGHTDDGPAADDPAAKDQAADASATKRFKPLTLPLDEFRCDWTPFELMASKMQAGDAEAYDGVLIYGLTFHQDFHANRILLLPPSVRKDWDRYGVRSAAWTVPTVRADVGSDLVGSTGCDHSRS